MDKNIERAKDGVDSMIDQARDTMVGAADRAERGVESATDRVMESTRTAGEYFRDGAETASRGAHRSLKSTAKALDQRYTRARTDLSRLATAATDYVTANPGKTVLLVGAAGFVLGTLTRRRRLSE